MELKPRPERTEYNCNILLIDRVYVAGANINLLATMIFLDQEPISINFLVHDQSDCNSDERAEMSTV